MTDDSPQADNGTESADPWIDKSWFYEEYWRKGRSLTDIASESKRSRAYITDIMRGLGIPIRKGDTVPTYVFKMTCDRETLFTLYWRKGLSINEIADRFGVSYTAVYNRMESFDPEIKRRPHGSESGYDNHQSKTVATLQWDSHGYRVWNIGLGASKTVKEHRATAIGEYGLDAVKGKHIHHANGIRWLNVPRFDMDIPELDSPNLEPVGPVVHAKR